MFRLTGKLEQEVMDILWEANEPLTATLVQKKINKKLAYTTVTTVLQRLLNKGLLDRKHFENTFVYYAVTSKEDVANKNLKSVFEGLIHSYGDLAVSQFMETVKDNKKTKELLRKILDNLDD